MSEDDVLKADFDRPSPVTVSSLVRDLRTLGVSAGDNLLVHSSLSSIGWVCGGAVAVVHALRRAVSDSGTLMMPAHSSGLSDPAQWTNPAVPKAWVPIVRAELPVYDPATTRTRAMGVIAETFRTQPGVLRSPHPIGSFAAVGPLASSLLHKHPLDDPFGENSPLARFYDADGNILLLGVCHGNNTALHLAEHRGNWAKTYLQQGSPVMVEGARRWVSYREMNGKDDDFPDIGRAYREAGHPQKEGLLGRAKCLLIPARRLVDFAATWIDKNRAEIEP